MFPSTPNIPNNDLITLRIMNLNHSSLRLVRLFLFFALLSSAIASISVRPSTLKKRTRRILKGNSLAASIGFRQIIRLQRQIIRKRSCNVRVCFALDGSASISISEYNIQKNLVRLIASLVSLDMDAKYSAFQYGLASLGISLLTSDARTFLKKVQKSRLAKASKTFVIAGVATCLSSIRTASNGAGKIVLIGDGRSNFADTSLPLVTRAIRDEDIIAIAIGFPSATNFFRKITKKNDSKTFNLSGYGAIGESIGQILDIVCKD